MSMTSSNPGSGLQAQVLAAGEAALAPDDGQRYPNWVRELRRRGAERFGRHGFPNPRLEAWKYTSLRGLEQALERLGTDGDATSAPAAASAHPVPAELASTPRLLMVDGALADSEGRLPDGVEALSIEDALFGRTDDGEDDLGQQVADLLDSLDTDHPARSLAALNDATLGRGLVLLVRAGVDAGRMLIQWTSSRSAERALCNSRVLLLLEEGARLSLLEQHAPRAGGAATAGLAPSALNIVCQASLGEGARLEQARLQQLDDAAVLVTLTEVRQQAGSEFRHAGLDQGGALARHDLHTRLAGEGASCDLDGAYLPRGHGHVDVHLAVQHAAANCRSSQFYRGVVDDRARAVFNGRVHVLPGADGTEARQSNANLLASPLAEVNTKPELEIEADEVVASHGATVGQLDETAVFYLRSRGLDEAAARQVLTGAFCRAVVERLPEGPVREAFTLRLAARLERSS
jgi:Fe-S cluster assembly protein SufD